MRQKGADKRFAGWPSSISRSELAAEKNRRRRHRLKGRDQEKARHGGAKSGFGGKAWDMGFSRLRIANIIRKNRRSRCSQKLGAGKRHR